VSWPESFASVALPLLIAVGVSGFFWFMGKAVK